MAKRLKRRKATGKSSKATERRLEGLASPHGDLVNEHVHIFVDDQNLFFGIVNQSHGPGFRIDFGRLLLEVSNNSGGGGRFIKSAYIAGIIPDDDSFWRIAENKGFTVRRGYLGANQRSKQDDAYLITDMTSTLYEEDGPSTIILVAGDADYVPPLKKSLEKGWRNEIAFIDRGLAPNLQSVTHEIRTISPHSIQYMP